MKRRNCRGLVSRGASLLLQLLLSGATPAAAAELTLSVEPRWRGQSIEIPSAPLANDTGQSLRLTRVALLVSGVTLLRADGGETRLEGQYGHWDIAEGRREFTVHGAPEGEFVGLEFSVGVPADVNHGDVGRWPNGHALNPLINRLHWSWQGGYVFAALEGRWTEVDAAPAAPLMPSAERGFLYHLATDARAMRVRFIAPFAISGASRVTLALDVARVLAPVTLEAGGVSESTHSAPIDPLADTLAARLERAWFWLEAESSTRARPTATVAGRTPPTSAPIVATEVNAGATAATGAKVTVTATATPLAFTVPAGFPQPTLPGDNPLTVEGVALGAALFTEPTLSGNGTQSCASCHAVDRAFSDAVALSVGADGAVGRRNAMPLFNLAWQPVYTWDGGRQRVRDQALAAWTNPIEMHGNPDEVVATLTRDGIWRTRFAAAFGSTEITAERVTLALEQYLLTIVSADSRFDRALRGADTLTSEEQGGFALFASEFDPARGQRGADCFHCHGGALFSDFAAKNNGLDRDAPDAGVATVTGNPEDAGKFKTPSLRNVALTGPYMHDGRFATLEDVVAHYDHGVQRAANLDPNLAKHPKVGLQLSTDDQRAIVAFLRTLTEARWETNLTAAFSAAVTRTARVEE